MAMLCENLDYVHVRLNKIYIIYSDSPLIAISNIVHSFLKNAKGILNSRHKRVGEYIESQDVDNR